jgi:hypothetical protein
MLKHVDDEQRCPARCIADAGDAESYWDRLLAQAEANEVTWRCRMC